MLEEATTFRDLTSGDSVGAEEEEKLVAGGTRPPLSWAVRQAALLDCDGEGRGLTKDNGTGQPPAQERARSRRRSPRQRARRSVPQAHGPSGRGV